MEIHGAGEKAFRNAKTKHEALENLRKMAQAQADEMVRKDKSIRLIAVLGSVGKELSGEVPVGSTIWEDTDLDLVAWTYATDFNELKAQWKECTPIWLSGAFALYDPDNLLPQLKAQCAKWGLGNRKKIVWDLWMRNLAIKRCAAMWVERKNIPAALWAARKAFEFVLDITLLLDNKVPCTPKYDLHCLRENIESTLLKLHTVQSTDAKAAEDAINEADGRHWELKEELEKFLNKKDIFDPPHWVSDPRFPIIKWL